jgi:uncharacterized membrane protein YgdD (TMEM256/DUF423 family)
MEWMDRALIGLAGLAGLAGVALSALASHAPAGPNIEIAARFLLVHAATLVGLAALLAGGALAPGLGRIAGAALVIGLALFCGDLLRRAYSGATLFPMAAPAGGMLLMAGWALLALAGFLAFRR